MRKHLFYNIKKYIDSIIWGESMQLEYILNSYNKAKRYELSDEVSFYMEYIDKEPFYISPDFTDIKTDRNSSSLNPKFVMFSAPGATGKTQLAKHISHNYGALYWNLAKLQVGSNSFIGSVLAAIGDQNYTQFINDLNDGKVYLVIDAFDEAEIISGRLMLSKFIDEINKSVKSPVKPTVFLLARTETAQFLAAYCAEKSIAINHYEIGFFNETSAKEFIEKYISEERKFTPADKDSVNKYYNLVKTNITEPERKSFLGYAPVLQAISKHILSYANTQKLISELTRQTDCVSVIISIMEDLLRREQNDKMIPALKESLAEEHPEFTDWDRLYSPEEQLIRIISYVLFDDTKYENYPLDFLPPQLIEEYQAKLDAILKQHPFVLSSFENKRKPGQSDFTGPAFRDYTLARLILNKSNEGYADMYFENSDSELYFPSQIFFDCYMYMSNNTIAPQHISYVYDSFKAKATAYESFHLECTEGEMIEGEKEYTATFEMIPGKRQNQQEKTIEAKLYPTDSPLVFEQLVNTIIKTPDLDVQIGRNGINSRVSNTSVICKSINWAKTRVSIEAYKSNGCYLVAKNGFNGTGATFEIANSDDLKVSSPNINIFYKLVPHSFDFEDCSNGVDIIRFTHALRCILSEFRTHRKDTLAKSAERIDYVVVGGSKIKQEVLDYLKFKGIIYQSSHLYKINEEIMQKIGIFFNALSDIDSTKMVDAYSDFTKWMTSH